MLLDLESSGRSERARWRERLLAHHERRILESSKLDDVLKELAVGSMTLDDAILSIGEMNDE